MTLSESASLRFVRDALRLRRVPTINLVLLRGDASLLAALRAQQAASASAAAAQLLSSSPSSVRDALRESYAAKQERAQTASKRRIARREAYMSEVEKRNDSGFFLRIAALVLGVPLVILAAAAQQGMLFRGYTMGGF